MVSRNNTVGHVWGAFFCLLSTSIAAQGIAQRISYPKVPAFPHFFVLDSDGTFLHSQGTADLEEGRGYNEKVFVEFLAKWEPKTKQAQTPGGSSKAESPSAEKVLAEGLERARSEKKKALIHLGAPS